MLAGFGVSACAHVETRLPVPSFENLAAETHIQEAQAFERYRDMVVRLDGISANILSKNADLCSKTRQDIGVRTHRLKSYPKHLREAAGRQLGALKTPVVFSVQGASNVKKGDVLLSGTQKPITTDDKDLQENLQSGEGSLSISRDGETILVPVTAATACDYKVSLRFSGAVNAYATGKSIIVTTGMMDFTKNDKELALVVGHELAHNTMGHVRKIIQNTILSGFATRTTRPFEAEADYVGLYYMARAGYAVDGVEMFWQRLGTQYPKSIVREKTHPVTPSRLLSIRLAAQEIKSKQEAGDDLIPNALKQER